MFEKRSDRAIMMAYFLAPFIALGGAVAGGSYLLGKVTEPPVPDQIITIRIPAADAAKIRNGAISDKDLGAAFRDAVKNWNSPVPPKLELPKGGLSGPAPSGP